MARRAFFSFHYGNDVWRANIVRNSWVTKPNTEAAGFIDKAEFEKIERTGDKAIKDWIDKQLIGTSVTVVLIGTETCKRPYVQYEVQKSYERGNGIIGIYIHQVKDREQNTCLKGDILFGEIGKDANGKPIYFRDVARVYDWINDYGYENLGKWIEEAAKKVGK